MFFIITVLGYIAAAGSLYWLLFGRQSSVVASAAPSVLWLQQKSGSLEPQVPPTQSDESWKTAWKATWKAVRHDVMLSIWSSGIFAVCASVMTSLYVLGYTRLYMTPEKYGFAYLGFSLLMVIFLQDTYFYFTHRLAHHPKCYRWLHRGHHHSNNPTPWTAFAFDPAEALVQALYLMGAVCLIPMHISVLCAVVLVMTMGALFHHISLRLFSASAFGDWLGSWIVGPTHHWFHHRRYTVHYGLYFTFWDRLLGTHTSGYADILSPEKSSLAFGEAEVSGAEASEAEASGSEASELKTSEAESSARDAGMVRTPPVLTALPSSEAKTVPFSSPLKKAS
ncbi:MAG: sterol desaturase family protein [Cyanobacteria bacterium J06623_5]